MRLDACTRGIGAEQHVAALGAQAEGLEAPGELFERLDALREFAPFHDRILTGAEASIRTSRHTCLVAPAKAGVTSTKVTQSSKPACARESSRFNRETEFAKIASGYCRNEQP